MLKINVKQSVFINRPAEEIFAYMGDIENMIDWSSIVISVRKISPGELHVGATVRSTIRFLGKWLDITFEIVEYEPSRYLTLKSFSGVTPCLFCYQFEPIEDGGTIVSHGVVIHLTGAILDLTESVVASVVCRQLEHDLLTLKAILEARTFVNPNILRADSA